MKGSGRAGRRSRGWAWLFALAIFLALVQSACVTYRRVRRARNDRETAQILARDPNLFLVTGYCNCGKCCSWHRDWFGLGEPVYDSGPNCGKPKKVGITASGKRATKGTIAADRSVFPLGTHLFVPGYGLGTVEDVGGSIRNRHIDVWFPTHEEACRWGRKFLKIQRR